jgi:hypothetical protein
MILKILAANIVVLIEHKDIALFIGNAFVSQSLTGG